MEIKPASAGTLESGDILVRIAPASSDGLSIELDVFDAPFAPLVLAEVEFESIEQAQAFVPPEWFGEDVTENREYSNSYLSRKAISQ